MNIEGQIADAVVAALVANKDKVTALLGTGEAAISVAAKNTVKNLPKSNGILGYVLPLIETEVDAEVDVVVNKFGPDELYALVLAEAKILAKDLGG